MATVLSMPRQKMWWYDGERIKFRSRNAGKLLSTLRRTPDISIASLAKTIGINKSDVQKLLKSMTDKGYIIRRGKNGDWHVLAISPL